jgi:hypothetical protein
MNGRMSLILAVLAVGLVWQGLVGVWAEAGEYTMHPSYEKMQKKEAESDAPVKEGEGFEIRAPEETEGVKQPFSQTVAESIQWVLSRHLTLFFIGLAVISMMMMGVFRHYFTKYMPKPKFKGGIILWLGSLLVSVFGLAVLGLGVVVLLGRVLPEFPVSSTAEAIGMVVAGAALFLLGIGISKGNQTAALVVVVLLGLDIARTLWLRRGVSGGEPLLENNRLLVEVVVAVLALALAVGISRRWKKLMVQEHQRERHGTI